MNILIRAKRERVEVILNSEPNINTKIIDIIGFHYITAFIHGYKHANLLLDEPLKNKKIKDIDVGFKKTDDYYFAFSDIKSAVRDLLKTLHDGRKIVLEQTNKEYCSDFEEGYLCGIDTAIKAIKKWLKDANEQ